jgi:hypothetical protein
MDARQIMRPSAAARSTDQGRRCPADAAVWKSIPEEFQDDSAPENGSVFGLADVAAAIALLVSGEVALIDPLCRIGFLAAARHRALVAIIGMEVSVDVATKAAGAMKPWARADEHVASKPLRAIVAGGSAAIRSGVIVTVRT